MRYIAPGWSEVHGMLRALSRRVVERGLRPDILVGVSMGGLIPAVVLSDLLGLEVDSVRVKYYKGIGEREVRPLIVQDVSANLGGRRALLVDDVSDSGQTLKTVRDYLLARGAEELFICTLHYKPWSLIKPDIYADETEAWIIYPWERREALGGIVAELRREGDSENDVRERMMGEGVPMELVEEAFPGARAEGG